MTNHHHDFLQELENAPDLHSKIKMIISKFLGMTEGSTEAMKAFLIKLQEVLQDQQRFKQILNIMDRYRSADGTMV